MKVEIDISELIHAINEDPAIKAPLLQILKQPLGVRNNALTKLTENMQDNGAPEDLINTLKLLHRPEVASKTLELLNTSKQNKSNSISYFCDCTFPIAECSFKLAPQKINFRNG